HAFAHRSLEPMRPHASRRSPRKSESTCFTRSRQTVQWTASTLQPPSPKPSLTPRLKLRSSMHSLSAALTGTSLRCSLPVFDLICSKGVVNHVSDADVQARLQAAHERQRKGGITHTQRLRSIINAELDAVHAAEVTAVVAQMEI